jgi:hypothetical protein
MATSLPVPTAQDLQELIFPLQLDINGNFFKFFIKTEHLKFI